MSVVKVDNIPVVKEDERGVIYRCEPVNYIARNKDTVSADHTHDEPETIYLVEGKIELTIGDETLAVEAPAKVFVPSGVYHKVVALTDIKLIRGN